MHLSRREILIAGLSLAATGCASTSSSTGSKSVERVGPIWPEGVKSPTRTAPTQPNYTHRTTPTPAKASTVQAVPGVTPRSKWTRHGTGRNVNAMNGVQKITIHHEGWTPVTFTSATAAYDRIERIRQIHTRDRGWADIGYHYIIDRAGRVIEGRPIKYQGAHVSNYNEHNLGILVLGNFEKQKPSNAQVQKLGQFTKQMMAAHKVSAKAVRTHREINPTKCPGLHLQPHINHLRRTGVIA